MKKLLFSFLLLLFVTSLSAQYQKIRMGLFKKWHVGTFTEVRGHYIIAIDTISDNYDLYEEEDEEFWSDQHDYQDITVTDSMRLTIRRNSIYYDNELFDCVFTNKVKPKYNYFEMVAENDKDRIIVLIMYPEGPEGWQIYISDSEKQGWEGIWKRRKL